MLIDCPAYLPSDNENAKNSSGSVSASTARSANEDAADKVMGLQKVTQASRVM